METVHTDVLAKIVKIDDNYFVVNTADESVTMPITKIVDDGKTFALPSNDSNRKWFNIAKANEAIDAEGYCPLSYKATKTVNSTSSQSKIPNTKLISYLPEDLQEEYKAIIARAIEARNAAKAEPKTEREKLEAKIAKAKKAYEKLMAQLTDVAVED